MGRGELMTLPIWVEHREKILGMTAEYHARVGCPGKVNGFFCSCASEIARMMVFKELSGKWLS
jgi:hypothetical protein